MSVKYWRFFLFLSTACLVLQMTLPGSSLAAERPADPAAAIVKSVLEAYGGERKVAKISSVIAKGRIAEFMSGSEGDYARYLERPGKLRIEVMPEQGGEERILNGDRGWQKGRNGLEEASAVMTRSMVYQYSYLDLPMGFADGSCPVTYGGKRNVGNREAYVLLVKLKDAPQLRVFIDVKTRLISRVAADFATGMMGSSELSTEYHDFRRVGGVLFPYRLVNFAGEMKLSEITLNKIVVNSKIPVPVFSPGPPAR